MGYTHYWRRPKELDPVKFKAFVADCQKLCDAVGIPLGNASGEEEPTFDEADKVCFNGHIHSAVVARQKGQLWLDSAWGDDGSYETFLIERIYSAWGEWNRARNDLFFAFCKTMRRPYDLNVQACLIALNEHFRKTIVSSDGESSDWDEARGICQRVLGYGSLFVLKHYLYFS